MQRLYAYGSSVCLAFSGNYPRNTRLHLKHKLAVARLLIGFNGLGNNLRVLLGGIPGARFLVITGATVIQI